MKLAVRLMKYCMGFAILASIHTLYAADPAQAVHSSSAEEKPTVLEDAPIANLHTNSFSDNQGKKITLGFVNLRRVMTTIPQLSNMLNLLNSEFSQQYDALQKENMKLKNLEEKLAALPRGEAYSNLEKQVIAERREVARLDASYRDAYSVRRNEELAKLQETVVQEIIALAKDEGYDVILNDTGVIYVSSKADLTGKVIMRLQKRNNISK